MADVIFLIVEIGAVMLTMEVAFPGAVQDWPTGPAGILMLSFLVIGMAFVWPLFLIFGLLARAVIPSGREGEDG